MAQVSRGWFKGHFAESPFSCATLAQTGASVTGTARWADGVEHDDRVKFENSPVRANDVNNGSFVGTARVALTFPSALTSLCASGKRIRSTRVTGTITLGPACGPGSGALTVYQIGPPSLMCGGVYLPNSITTGPDGALWFANLAGTIGRITTSGAVTVYKLPLHDAPISITAGPDGALWFTNQAVYLSATSATGGSVGRITTSGAVTIYPVASGTPGDITAGSDGALWFVNYGPFTSPASIDRITTSGTITAFTNPSIEQPTGLTAGPDGALWFADALHNSIGRFTTSGSLTTFTSPLIDSPFGITSGPDGALWFTNGNSIGRITTSGAVTRYSSPTANNPWSIAAGPDGNLWFTNYAGSPGIGRITTSGIISAQYSDPSIVNPYDITAGSDGDMWFTNYSSDTIGRISPP